MKITLCHSTSFMGHARKITKQLESMGHEVLTAPYTERSDAEIEKMLFDRENYIKNMKPKFIREHFDNILSSDSILVINLNKDDIRNYIGASTFAEIMFAFYNKKKIFILNPLPEKSMFTDELEAINPIILNNDLDMIM
jgi:diphthamide synthase subunit DPH2